MSIPPDINLILEAARLGNIRSKPVIPHSLLGAAREELIYFIPKSDAAISLFYILAWKDKYASTEHYRVGLMLQNWYCDKKLDIILLPSNPFYKELIQETVCLLMGHMWTLERLRDTVWTNIGLDAIIPRRPHAKATKGFSRSR